MLIRLIPGDAPAFVEADDPFSALGDEDVPGFQSRDLLLSVQRFHSDGDRWLSQGRRIGVKVKPDEPVEALAYDLPRLSLVVLEFPSYRDGRAYSAAMLLRERYGFRGQLRATGEVLRDQAKEMLRCGFDAFEPADGSTPGQWTRAALRYRHVYQAAGDRRVPGCRERTRLQ